jgi:hypothetical protein
MIDTTRDGYLDEWVKLSIAGLVLPLAATAGGALVAGGRAAKTHGDDARVRRELRRRRLLRGRAKQSSGLLLNTGLDAAIGAASAGEGDRTRGAVYGAGGGFAGGVAGGATGAALGAMMGNKRNAHIAKLVLAAIGSGVGAVGAGRHAGRTGRRDRALDKFLASKDPDPGKALERPPEKAGWEH